MAGRTDGRRTRASAARRRALEALVDRLSTAEDDFLGIDPDQVDAIVDPATAAPILLSRAQEALARSEARHRGLLERAPAIVLELQADGTVTYANPAVRPILGFSPRELEGQSFWRRTVDDGGAALGERMAAAMARADVTGFELPHGSAEGGRKWVAWNSANRYAADGTLESVVLFGVDVTSRHEAEENARRLAETEFARVRAEASNRAKSEFLAAMSHDLRTPLNAIMGYTDLVALGLRGPVTEAQVEDLGRIQRSASYLLGLVNGIVDYAGLEAGHATLMIEGISVADAFETLRAVVEPQANAKGLRYDVIPCEPGLQVRADREKLQQTLANLASNAIKFTPAGGKVSVRCRAAGRNVSIAVADNGPGIPPDMIEAIFEPFVQVDRGPRSEQQGVGLGLSIGRKLARAMGGELTVETRLGQGSTFLLTLPRAG